MSRIGPAVCASEADPAQIRLASSTPRNMNGFLQPGACRVTAHASCESPKWETEKRARALFQGRSFQGRCGKNFFHVNQWGWIFSGIAGAAVRRLVAFGTGLLQAFEREISQRIGPDVAADFFHALVGGDELVLRGRIYPIEAGRNGWRAGDAHVHLARSGIADHAHNLAAGSAAHDGVVD